MFDPVKSTCWNAQLSCGLCLGNYVLTMFGSSSLENFGTPTAGSRRQCLVLCSTTASDGTGRAFVQEKSQVQLDLQACHRVRSRLVSRRTATINQIRDLASEL